MSGFDASAKNYQYRELISRYVDVCNAAMHENRDRFPFKQILGAAQTAEHNHPIEVVVTGALGAERYVFKLEDTGLNVDTHESCKGCPCIRKWITKEEYLRDVTVHAPDYISNPARLNWEWMFDAAT